MKFFMRTGRRAFEMSQMGDARARPPAREDHVMMSTISQRFELVFTRCEQRERERESRPVWTPPVVQTDSAGVRCEGEPKLFA